MGSKSLVSQHHITNTYIEVYGQEAAVESYFLAFSPSAFVGGEPSLGMIGGRYLDRFAYRDGRWAISSRRVIVDFGRDSLEGAEWRGISGYPRGGGPADDPSLDHFAPQGPDVPGSTPILGESNRIH
jgi:hypothetical protein